MGQAQELYFWNHASERRSYPYFPPPSAHANNLPAPIFSHLCDTEVPEFNNPRPREEDVLRLEIPVQNLPVVDVLESKRCLHEPGTERKNAKNRNNIKRRRASRPRDVTS